MRLWFARLKHRKTKEERWVRVRRDGKLNPHDHALFGRANVPEWTEVEAPAPKAGITAIEAGQGVICTPESITTDTPKTSDAIGSWSPDDSEVPVIESTKYADGWRSEVMLVHLRNVDIIISPDGTRYIEANGRGNADLIVDLSKSKNPQLGRVRYRLLEGSRMAKQNHKEKKAAVKRAKAKKAKKATRKKATRAIKKKAAPKKKSTQTRRK